MLDILNELIILFFDWFEVIFGLVTGYILLRLFGISSHRIMKVCLFCSAYIALMVALVFWVIPYFYGNL